MYPFGLLELKSATASPTERQVKHDPLGSHISRKFWKRGVEVKLDIVIKSHPQISIDSNCGTRFKISANWSFSRTILAIPRNLRRGSKLPSGRIEETEIFGHNPTSKWETSLKEAVTMQESS